MTEFENNVEAFNFNLKILKGESNTSSKFEVRATELLSILLKISKSLNLDTITSNGNSTNNNILIGSIELIALEGLLKVTNVNLEASSPASVNPNTLGVDDITGKLYFKNILNEIIYLDNQVDNLSFDSLTGVLTLTDEQGNTSSVSLDGRYITVYERGASNGVAPLGVDGKVPSSYLPAVPINNTFVVADEPSRLALPADIGDVAVQTDTQESYILQSKPASTKSNWVLLLFPASVVSVNGQTGVVNLSTTDVPEGTNKYANSTSVNPLIQDYLGRGVFLYNSANKYIKYSDIPSAISASVAGDRIVLANYNATISSPIVISKDINILSIDSAITNTSASPIFTDNGNNTTLFLRGQLYLRNNNVLGTAFSFTGVGGFLYLDGVFDFRDTKTTVTCAKQYCLIGINTQPTDVFNFTSASGFGGNLISRGVGIINYSGSGTHFLTGVANVLNVTNTSVVTQGERTVFDVTTNKATLRSIVLNSGNIVLNTHLVNPLIDSCITSTGTSTIKSFNTVFVSISENIVKSSGTLNAQLNNSQFITGAASPLTTDGSFNVTMGYSTGNKPIASFYDGPYFDSTNFTSPIL